MANNPGRISIFASLRNRDFRLFSIGMFFSFTALQMQTLTLNYLVFHLTGTAKAIGYVNAITGFCMLVFSFAGGLAADRLSKRNLMSVTQTGICLITLALGILVSTRLVTMEHIYVFSLIFGILSAINAVSRQSFLPDLVGTNNLTNASGLVAANMSLTRIIGPALGGFLIGLFGAAPTFYIKTLGHILFVTLLLLIPIKGVGSTPPGSLLGDAIEGWRYLRRDRKVFDLTLFGIIPIVIGAPYLYFLPVFQKVVFNVGAAELGLMMAVTGVGALIGSLSIAALGNSLARARIQFITGAGFGISLLLFGATAAVGNFSASLGMLTLVGMSGTAFVALNGSLVQRITPPEMQGRIQALFIAGMGLMSLGGLPMGAMVDAVGPSLTMVFFGGATFLFVTIMTLARPNVRRV